jgi:Peptidase M15
VSNNLLRSFFLAVLSIVLISVSVQEVQAIAPTHAVGVIGGGRLNKDLRRLLVEISSKFGRPVIVTSGCRSSKGNRRAGGARRSFHLSCQAADIKVIGVSEATVLRVARNLTGRGGIGTYCRNTVVHIDVGPRRQWHEGCGRKLRNKSSRSLVQYARR